MAGDWTILPPLGDEHYPRVSHGSLVRQDFDIVRYPSASEMSTCFQWTGLSRQDLSNLRNLAHSDALSELVRPYGYGIGSSSQGDLLAAEDPNDAEFGLLIDSKEDIPPTVLSEIVDFVKRYRVP